MTALQTAVVTDGGEQAGWDAESAAVDRAFGDSRDVDPHAVALAGMSTKSDAIDYAVSVLCGAPPVKVMTWLAEYGVTVSRSKVSPAVRKYRDAHHLTGPTPAGGKQRVSGPAHTGGDGSSARPMVSVADTTSAAAASHVGRVPDVPPNARNDVVTVPVAARGAGVPDPGGISAREQRAPWVAFACYAVAAVSLAVSLNTSWRFFEQVLHIPVAYGERYVMFAVAELALVVCGAGMAVNVHRDGRPGAFGTIVWAMCSAMAYMAWAESTPDEAIGRILLGPLLGTVMLHLGLGLELHSRHPGRSSTARRVARELRERCLSWMGLSDDERDAAQRTRDRKAYKAAALSLPHRAPWSRRARLERALLAAGVADDPRMRDRLLARLAVVRHAAALSTVNPPSPWE